MAGATTAGTNPTNDDVNLPSVGAGKHTTPRTTTGSTGKASIRVALALKDEKADNAKQISTVDRRDCCVKDFKHLKCDQRVDPHGVAKMHGQEPALQVAQYNSRIPTLGDAEEANNDCCCIGGNVSERYGD
eukprot:scaffold229748_cov30-Tisochrysis_lutea.AAC.1